MLGNVCPAVRSAATGPSGKWQATSCPDAVCGRNGGSSSAQISSANGHLVRNLQPDGGCVGANSAAGETATPAAPPGCAVPLAAAPVAAGPDTAGTAAINPAVYG